MEAGWGGAGWGLGWVWGSGHPEGVLGDPKGACDSGDRLRVRAVGHSRADWVDERGWGQGTGMGWGGWVA
jgi:hypothetical protein